MPLGAKVYNNGKALEVILGPERTQQVKLRLNQGESVKDMVALVQGEWGLLNDKKPDTVRTMLYRFNREVVAKETAQRVMETVKTRGHVAVDTLEQLDKLCRKQTARVEKVLALEGKASGILIDQASKEIRLLNDMLGNLAHLQMETGLLPRAPKTVQGVMMGADGRPTHFGWVENDENLLARLEEQLQGPEEIVHDPQ